MGLVGPAEAVPLLQSPDPSVPAGMKPLVIWFGFLSLFSSS
jgi:hypothetical protein